MNLNRTLASVGTAVAASKAAKTVSNLHFADVLHAVGLERHRSRALENMGLIAVGAFVGAGVALLFAPSAGRETREQLGRKLNELGSAAKTDLPERLSNFARSEKHATHVGQS